MTAEVISIGDELTSGQRLDTNSQWLSQQLGDLGLRVMYHTTVADDLAANVAVFQQACERSDIIVCTGGLGPTADDLTRQALAAAAGVGLELDPPSLEHIRQLFARRQRPMPPTNEIQAYFPVGARIIPNPHGSAPGIDMDLPRSERPPARIFCLPGVPAEMKEMWAASVEPALAAAAGPDRRVLRHFAIKCFGVGESDLEQMLPDLIRRGRDPLVGITASQATLTLRISASGATEADCRAHAQPTIETIRQCLGTLVVSEADEELPEVVARQLTARGQSLATVEIGTPGLLAGWLAGVADSGAWRRGSLVLPAGHWPAETNSQAAPLAAVETDRALQAAALARRVREWFQADFGLAVGAAPPTTGQGLGRPTIPLALADSHDCRIHHLAYTGHPDILATRAAKHALNDLRLRLLES